MYIIIIIIIIRRRRRRRRKRMCGVKTRNRKRNVDSHGCFG